MPCPGNTLPGVAKLLFAFLYLSVPFRASPCRLWLLHSQPMLPAPVRRAPATRLLSLNGTYLPDTFVAREV